MFQSVSGSVQITLTLLPVMRHKQAKIPVTDWFNQSDKEIRLTHCSGKWWCVLLVIVLTPFKPLQVGILNCLNCLYLVVMYLFLFLQWQIILSDISKGVKCFQMRKWRKTILLLKLLCLHKWTNRLQITGKKIRIWILSFTDDSSAISSALT